MITKKLADAQDLQEISKKKLVEARRQENEELAKLAETDDGTGERR